MEHFWDLLFHLMKHGTNIYMLRLYFCSMLSGMVTKDLWILLSDIWCSCWIGAWAFVSGHDKHRQSMSDLYNHQLFPTLSWKLKTAHTHTHTHTQPLSCQSIIIELLCIFSRALRLLWPTWHNPTIAIPCFNRMAATRICCDPGWGTSLHPCLPALWSLTALILGWTESWYRTNCQVDWRLIWGPCVAILFILILFHLYLTR